MNNQTTAPDRELLELDLMKSRFIASISHELRTPLNAIIGFSQILINEWPGPLNDEQKEHLDTIRRSGKLLSSQINNILVLSQMEAGMINAFPENFDVHDVISAVALSAGNEIGNKAIILKVQTVRQLMHTDRERLFQCLSYLASNAAKFTEMGTITIRAEVLDGGDMLALSVEDTGIGIDEKDFDKLFSRFSRLDSPLRSAVPGAGLGLHIARKLCQETLLGELTVTSTPGAGSRFVLTVPIDLKHQDFLQKSSTSAFSSLDGSGEGMGEGATQ